VTAQNVVLKGGKVKAKVVSIVSGATPYVVTSSESVHGSVTFSLSPDSGVWKEDGNPSVGVYVVLGDIRKFQGGWRAFEARFYRPEDEGVE
jgi:hypothetical protein